MAEVIILQQELNKEEKYSSFIPQLIALMEGENDVIANVANIVAALKHGFNFFWVGIYFVKDKQLVLGPFQGPVACTRINFGKGVCGTSWQKKETIIVDNVDEFPGHIACSADSKSEIVIPFFKNGGVAGVLDVDSDRLAAFDSVDSKYLNEVARLIENCI